MIAPISRAIQRAISFLAQPPDEMQMGVFSPSAMLIKH